MWEAVTATGICLTGWLGLRAWYCGREMGMKKLSEYGQVWKKKDGLWMDIAALAGMSCAYLLGSHHGLACVQCIRNALVLVWLLLIALVDGRKQIIPRALTNMGWLCWILLGITAVITGTTFIQVLLFSAGGLLLGGGVLLLCRLVSKGGMGMGDVRLFGVLGVLYGMNYTFSILFFTIALMSVYGLIAILFRRKGMKSMLPMGPFALAAYGICIVLGV